MSYAIPDMTNAFELFYGSGGHGGPYFGLNEAINAAIRYLRGCRSARAVYIKPYEKKCWEDIKAVQVVEKRLDHNTEETILVRNPKAPYTVCPLCNRVL